MVNFKSMVKHKLIINALVFQVLWFTCVQGNNLFALIALVVLLAIHQTLFRPQAQAWQLIILFSLLGYFGDSLITQLFSFHYMNQQGLFAPIWLLGLWVGFSTTLNHSLKWIFNAHYYLILTAFLAVPASYMAGIKLSNTQLEQTLLSSPWAFLFTEATWWTLMLSGFKKIHNQLEVKHV